METKTGPDSEQALPFDGFSEPRFSSPVASTDTVLLGRRFPPQAQLMLYSPDGWEDFVEPRTKGEPATNGSTLRAAVLQAADGVRTRRSECPTPEKRPVTAKRCDMACASGAG